MKTRALLVAVPLFALAACAQPGVGTVVVQGICAPTNNCQFTASCSEFALGDAIADPGATDYVTLFFQVSNQLADNSDASSQRNDTNNAIITSAEIEYTGALTGTDSRGVSGAIPSSSTSIVMLDIIPADAFAPLLTATDIPAWPSYVEVIARLKLHGNFGDGSHFTTAEVPVTIKIATGTGARADSFVPQPAATAPSLVCALACPHVGQYPATCMQ